MRVGQNPAKSIEQVAKPADITVAIVTYIPYLGGYYAESLEVLKVCLESLWEHTDLPYDLLVFDNASCPEVRAFLSDAQQQGKIQFLVSSDRNMGKGGAWNLIFGGAPGRIIAYADSDIYFYPGWLSAQVQALESIPEVGMVTGMPLWSPLEFSTSTIKWAESNPEARLERGKLLPWEDYWRHLRSLGYDEESSRGYYASHEYTCLHYRGGTYYVGAGHFQFVARREVLQSALPIPSERPMGQVRSLDIALDKNGYLRLSTTQWWVQHLGNTLQGFDGRTAQQPAAHKGSSRHNGKRGFWGWKPAHRLLTWINDRTFKTLYRS
jgi:glycosyltransferase involved in cell wall biosynthesis